MLINGVSRIFAHKKTIKQFLQQMIEQVLVRGGGGVWMCRENVQLFLDQLFRVTIFLCCFFFQFTRAFFRSILPIFAYFFAVYYVYFIKKSSSVLGTKFS